MTRDQWRQLERRCQKPDFRTVGNWYARRVSRPLALHVTRVILPTGISAHAITLAAWACGLGAAAALALGTWQAWLIAAGLLQISYLLDHVDGQIARYRQTASLDGIALDYLMHHTLNWLMPLAVGYGQVAAGGSHAWLLCGAVWACGAWLVGIEHDVRCKAIVARLKRLHGELRVVGGRGGRPAPPAPWPRTPIGVLARGLRMLGQWHVVVNMLTALAIAQALLADGSWLVRTYLLITAPTALIIASVQLIRSIRSEAAEHEFAAWYEPPEGCTLRTVDGWWHVEPVEPSSATQAADPSEERRSHGNSMAERGHASPASTAGSS